MPSNATNSKIPFLDAIISRIRTREFFFISLVFILGFAVRAYLMRYELIFEFDSYWHARMVSYILQGLPVPTLDPLAYYQNPAAASIAGSPVLFWYISAAIYKILTLNGAYTIESWILVVKILPALFGALICVGMFFLGRELFKGHHHANTAGLFAGILAAVVPSFVYRTMGGFYEDDSFGFLPLVVGLVFFVRAVREPKWSKENLINAALAGLSFALMVFTWSAFNVLVPILLGIGFVQFLMWLRENESAKAVHYAGIWAITFAILAAAATLQTGVNWLSQFGVILGFVIFRAPLLWWHTVLFIVAFFLLCAALWYMNSRVKNGHEIVRKIYAIFILILVLAPLIVAIVNVSLRTGDVLGQTVGEESDGKNYFGNKYNALVLFAIIGIPAMGYLLIKKTRNYEHLAIPLLWLLVTFFMAWGKLKFTYYWGLPLALAGAVVCVLALRWMSTKSINMQKLAAAGIGLMIMISMAAGIIFVAQNVPNIEQGGGWKTALFWADDHLQQDAKFFNWWDEGHWISFLSGRKVLIDNRNADPAATADVARFILSADENQAAAIVDKYESTHLIFGDDLLEKLTNFGFYAYNTTDGSDPRLQGYFGRVFPCAVQQTALTKETTYSCGGNSFSVAQMNAFPTTWQSTPTTLQDGVPLNIYRDEDNSRVYAFAGNANKSMLVRLWFGEASTQADFTEIYRNAGGVRIFQTN